ncbi:serine/threonine protein kinase [Streptomyces profundus]|nr:serine/threonine protein kinase [Streptomyces sp. MA3_2.13]
MGRVYLSHTPGGRPVAIKVIHPELASDPDFRQRLQQEVRAAQRVQGPYTAPVIDSDTEGPRPWFAAAYVAGPSLYAAVRTHGPLPLPAAARLLAGIAEALRGIHGAGVVHRDLKPSNVLLAQDGPRVIDFGISRALDFTSLTRSGFTAGTPAFMAPEQAMGQTATAAVDIFSLGMVAAFATIGSPPFGDGPPPAVLYRIVHEEPDLAGLPPALRELTARCLAREPAERPTAAEVVEECQRLLVDAPESADGWLPPAVAAEVERHLSTVTSLPPAVPAPAAPGPAVPPPGAWGPGTLPPATAQRRGRGRLVAFLLATGLCAALAGGAIGAMVLGGDDNGVEAGSGGDDDADTRGGDGGQEEPSPSPTSPEPSDEPEPDPEPTEQPEPEPEPTEQPDPNPEPEDYADIDIPARYMILFTDDPPTPRPVDNGGHGRGDFSYSYFTNSSLSTEPDNNMVLLEPGQDGSLDVCRAETRFTNDIVSNYISPGIQICVTTARGDIALVTLNERVTRTNSPSSYVNIDLTVWRSASRPDADN